ncbi:tetratricopeptide repeat protein [Streptomyces adustus]|uniref:tetratricopeptide repeat protein n=1 Tax=Streptomyces adustus TaxID=1609272 RepID=UPI0035DD3299
MSTTADRADIPDPPDTAAAVPPAAAPTDGGLVSARDTGDAQATDGGTAVSGHRGPAPSGNGTPVLAQATKTGDATAIGPGATAVSGNLIVHHRGPQEPAPWPHQVGAIPSRAQSFQPRAEATRLREALHHGGTAMLGQVLTGMGGVGKTQLAADHARTMWQDGAVDVLVWVTAANRTAVVAGYAQAGVELCRADPNHPERAAAAFLAWLEPKKDAPRCRWLVVLDDVTDPGDLNGLWPPASPLGQVVATTRSREAALAGVSRRLIEVGLFTPAEALAYLTEALTAHGRTEPDDQLTALAADLGHLPLALSQATAYLADADITATDYRVLLADRATALADAAPDALPDDQHHTVAAALTLSLDRADTMRPASLARPMLHLAAFLDANGIPLTVLTSPLALTLLTAHRSPPSSQAPGSAPARVGEREAVAALRALHRLHLIDHTSDNPQQAVRIHQLTQHAVRDTLTRDQHHQLARTAADGLLESWPEVERDTALAQALRANTTALMKCAENALYQPDAHAVLFRAGQSLGEAGQAASARDYFRYQKNTATRHLGPDHPDTLTARHDLAFWRGVSGDAAGAAAAFAELLPDRIRVQGSDHPSTLATRSNLARWRGVSGDAAGAAAAFAELLPDRIRVQGPDHPTTLANRHNLARWRGVSGDAAGAAVALAELLPDRIRILGPDHLDTLNTRHDLAFWRGVSGDAASAAVALAELLPDRIRILGPDHPDTLTARHDLAFWRGVSGDAASAAAAFAELLPDRIRVQGPDHPSTLTARHNLAQWRGKAGDVAGAVAAFAELLPDRIRVQGPDHPDTLNTRHDLAYWRGVSGDAAGAVAAFAELLPDRIRVQGPDHPFTLATRNNLARWRGKAGDAAGAVAAFIELLPDRIRVQGPDHPDTLTTRHDLAYWRGVSGDAAGAVAAFIELLPDRIRILGPDHPDTLTTRQDLARWRGKAGDVGVG